MHKNYADSQTGRQTLGERAIDPSFVTEARQAGSLAGCAQSGRYGIPSVQERIGQAIAQYEDSARRASAAQRAREILDKYPEFGELLDLLGRF